MIIKSQQPLISRWTNQHYFQGYESQIMPPEVNRYKKASQSVKTALRGVEFIAQHIRNADKDVEVKLKK